MAGSPIIMLGVGATKAGTSWLHRYLSSHPDCHFRLMKELHYFNSIDFGRVDRRIDELTAEIDSIEARMSREAPTAQMITRQTDRADLRQLLMRGDDAEGYLAYLREGAGEAPVVGEVTPAYALLSWPRLRAMAQMAADVRFVYLIRDPVARLWSHVRMIATRRGDGLTPDPRRAARILKRVLRGDEQEIARRGDYRAALEKLSKAVDPKKLCVIAFEDLVSGRDIDRLCRFLGLKPHAPDLRPVNAGDDMTMTSEQRHDARRWLDDQYEFVADWLGRRPTGWAYELAEESD
ncbi:sulfotransferase [Gymnodinialimonas sp. 2305UL16-5]|uniref:sulfotransferase family protein n=1 Tax=Gymnodinialimonas mytili TaxID=3126503 RepID=UPI0030B4EEDB